MVKLVIKNTGLVIEQQEKPIKSARQKAVLKLHQLTCSYSHSARLLGTYYCGRSVRLPLDVSDPREV